MKEQFENMTERDKKLLVVLLIILGIAGLYFAGDKIISKKDVLQEENATLISQQDVALGKFAQFEETKSKLALAKRSMDEELSKTHTYFDSPISIERMIFEWMEERQIEVMSFSATEPSLVTLTASEKEDKDNPKIIEDINLIDGEKVELNEKESSETEDIKEESEEKINDSDTSEENSDEESSEGNPEGNEGSKPKEEEEEEGTPVWLSTFKYELKMNYSDYLELVDYFNSMTRFYHLRNTSISAEENYWVASIELDVYSYPKPNIAREVENLEYFYYNMYRFPSQEEPKEKPLDEDKKPNEEGKLTPEKPAIEIPDDISNNKGESIYDRK